MNGDGLRDAAHIMRDHARRTAAADKWSAEPHRGRRDCLDLKSGDLFLAHYVLPAAAAHMASWTPEVAEAAANLLDVAAEEWDEYQWPLDRPLVQAAVDLALAYVGDSE